MSQDCYLVQGVENDLQVFAFGHERQMLDLVTTHLRVTELNSGNKIKAGKIMDGDKSLFVESDLTFPRVSLQEGWRVVNIYLAKMFRSYQHND